MGLFKTNGQPKEIDLTKLRGKIKVEVEQHRGKKGGEYYSLKAKFEDGFALVRASNTGPNITMRFEATTESRLKELQGEFTTELNKAIEEIK